MRRSGSRDHRRVGPAPRGGAGVGCPVGCHLVAFPVAGMWPRPGEVADDGITAPACRCGSRPSCGSGPLCFESSLTGAVGLISTSRIYTNSAGATGLVVVAVGAVGRVDTIRCGHM